MHRRQAGIASHANFISHHRPLFDTHQHTYNQSADGQTQVAGKVVEVIENGASGNLKVGQRTEGQTAEAADKQHHQATQPEKAGS